MHYLQNLRCVIRYPHIPKQAKTTNTLGLPAGFVCWVIRWARPLFFQLTPAVVIDKRDRSLHDER